MRTFGLVCALALVAACDDDDAVPPQTVDRSLLDASAAHGGIDASEARGNSQDASALAPSCATLDVCTDSKPGLLYNVCISGEAGAVSQPACLVDPNGVLYLAPLASGQVVLSQGWTQSTNATLSAADQARCESARAALLTADAATPPKCAGQ